MMRNKNKQKFNVFIIADGIQHRKVIELSVCHVILYLTDEFHHTLIPSMNLHLVLISHGHNFSVTEISSI